MMRWIWDAGAIEDFDWNESVSARKHIDAWHRNVGTLLLHEGREQPIAAAYVQYAHI